jgi:hypothetical protein
MLATRKLGQLIQRLLPNYTEPLDFNQLRDTHGTLFATPEATDRAASETMRDWMDIPQALNAIADNMERVMDGWQTLLFGSYAPPEPDSAGNSESDSPRSEGKESLA